ncbi:hypothetical protein HLB44_08675 [Aquincola sp. S2]|uniref:Alpha/beta hydrolase n=1 Tax=Pseudaquabacterium terrae TaxID=2732868 RepID=A0ABX2EEK8_9BURK|nr:hypothetical protein [Aquabacterium terrae]NRF67053.1 hypothetical protein [Aquabacterium terrae]
MRSDRGCTGVLRAGCGLVAFLAALGTSLAAQADSASLLAQAQAADPVRYAFVVARNTEIRATSDNKAFTMWWQPATGKVPAGVIVPLSGHDGWAHDGIYLWHAYAEKYGYAILSLQWWFGAGEATDDYYRPEHMYPLIAAALSDKGVKPGSVFFNGFSRGSANSYAMAALDHAATGRRFFGLVLSNAGGAAANYPPNQQIESGAFGPLPFSGIRWAMYCGQKDPDPMLSGCPAMTAARDWVVKHGASVVLFIDDPNGDHGGFMLNSANVETALASYAAILATTSNVLSNAESDCLFSWGEDTYAALLSPRRPASLVSAPYYYRHYAGTNTYVGVSSADNHLYLLDGRGALSDLGPAAPWSARAGCR